MIVSVDADCIVPVLKIWDNNPPHVYDAPNPDSSRIGFTAKLPAGSQPTLKVSLSKK